MRFKLFSFLCLLFIAIQSKAQTHTFCALDMDCTWTGVQTYTQPVGQVNINGLIFPNEYTGSTATIKQDAAISGLSGAIGVLYDTPLLSCGEPTSIPNNVLIIDYRQCTDIVPGAPNGSTTRPARPQLVLTQQRLGEFDEIPLTGTVTIPNDGVSTGITGVGTLYNSELSIIHYLTPVIRLSSASTSNCWIPISANIDNTNVTAAGVIPIGCGGTGPAVMMRGQLGQGCNTILSGGYPNTQAMGEYSCYQGIIHRTAGERGIYGANYSLRYDTPATDKQGQAYVFEGDLLNASGVDDVNSNNSYGIYNVSAGTNLVGTGLFISSTNTTNLWRRGIYVNRFHDIGILVQDNSLSGGLPLFEGIPYANDTNAQIVGRNASNLSNVWRINNDGSNSFPSLNITQTLSEPSVEGTMGVFALTGTAISGVNTHRIEPIQSRCIIGATNTQNWTGLPVACAAIILQPQITTGATGTVTGIASALINPIVSAGTVTNVYGNYFLAPTGAGTITNIYTSYGEQNAGIAYTYDGYKTASKYTTTATTNQFLIGTTPNLTTLTFPAPSGGVTLTFPNTADTMVGRATTDTLTNKTLTSPSIGSPTITSGIAANGSGYKHQSITTGSISTITYSDVTLTWATTFADANYTPICSVLDSTSAAVGLSVNHIQAINAATLVVTVYNGSVGSLTGTLECVAVHN